MDKQLKKELEEILLTASKEAEDFMRMVHGERIKEFSFSIDPERYVGDLFKLSLSLNPLLQGIDTNKDKLKAWEEAHEAYSFAQKKVREKTMSIPQKGFPRDVKMIPVALECRHEELLLLYLERDAYRLFKRKIDNLHLQDHKEKELISGKHFGVYHAIKTFLNPNKQIPRHKNGHYMKDKIKDDATSLYDLERGHTQFYMECREVDILLNSDKQKLQIIKTLSNRYPDLIELIDQIEDEAVHEVKKFLSMER